jgi:hypothetical protein
LAAIAGMQKLAATMAAIKVWRGLNRVDFIFYLSP